MMRVLSISGLGVIFLMISPKLRDQVQTGLGAGVSSMELYAPYSYVAFVFLVLATLVFSFNRGSKAR